MIQWIAITILIVIAVLYMARHIFRSLNKKRDCGCDNCMKRDDCK